MKAESLYFEATDPMFRPTDDQTIVSVENEYGRPIQFYDDGYGPLFFWYSQCGNFPFLAGVIRAPKLHDAYEILCDEFLPECDLSMDEITEKYGDDFFKNESFSNDYGFRPNGANKNDKHGHGIYQLDPSGEYLSRANGEIYGVVIKYKTEE